jgi:hypothetical protein
MYDEVVAAEVHPRQVAWEGIIANQPTDLSKLVTVTIPGIDDSIRWTKLRWQSRNSTDVPQRGDKCLVIFDDNDRPWVVAWWPF